MSQRKRARKGGWKGAGHDPGGMAWKGGCVYDLGVNYILIISIWLAESESLSMRVRIAVELN